MTPAFSSIRRSPWERKPFRCALAALLLVLACRGGAASAAVMWQEAIDYTKLKSRVADLSIGAGGTISIVEGTDRFGQSWINTATGDFNGNNDPAATPALPVPVQIVNGSGVSTGSFSNHATTMAAQFFGDLGSMAPGANSVVHYEAASWMANVLHINSSTMGPNPPRLNPLGPPSENFRVQNHSWAHTHGPGVNAQDLSALRRFDYVIETSDLTAAVGLNNYDPDKPDTHTHPHLLSHSYNGIAVGRSDSYHSRGMTKAVYGIGRYKPDLVVAPPDSDGTPPASSSRATATVSSAATLLHQSGAGTDAVRSETMKATLLAGATKGEFANFVDPIIGGFNRWNQLNTLPGTGATRPLDDLFGAGELNIYNSYLIQFGGQHAGAATLNAAQAAAPVGSYGWDYKDKTAVGDVYYNFEIPTGSTADELSIILTWNANVSDTDAGSNFVPVQSLQNLDLEFYDSTGSFLGEQLRKSDSAIDNVEHIYMTTDLDPGVYTLKVSGAADWDYGLAWRMATRFDQPSADFDEDGFVSGGDFLIWQRNFGTLLGAAHGDGDADGDGDVDDEDLALFSAGAIAAPMIVGSLVASVPEPATLALAAASMGLLVFSLRRRRRSIAGATGEV